MIKRYCRLFIITAVQFILLVVITILASILLQEAPSIKQWHQFFLPFKLLFVITHVILFCIFFSLWPMIVSLVINCQQEKPAATQIAQAIHIRSVLALIFVVFELLAWMN